MNLMDLSVIGPAVRLGYLSALVLVVSLLHLPALSLAV